MISKKTFYSKNQEFIKLYKEFDVLSLTDVNNAIDDSVDFIDLDFEDFQKCKIDKNMLSHDTYHLKFADLLYKTSGKYTFAQTLSSAFIQQINLQKVAIDRENSAMIVGDYKSLSSFTIALVRLGFKKIFLVGRPTEEVMGLIERLKKIYFQIDFVFIDEIFFSNHEEICSLLIVDINHNEHKDLVESISYFNFLAPQSIFLDLNGTHNLALISEAEKASVYLLDTSLYYKCRESIILNLV